MVHSTMTAIGPEALSLKLNMRRLWSDHVIWTRVYIMDSTAGKADPIAALPSAVRTPAGEQVPAGVFEAVGPVLGETDAAAGRLLKNQEDLGNAIVPYYGDDAGRRLTSLLKEHIMIAVDLIKAAKTGDKAEFGKYDAKWTANAREIAKLLNGANPEHWALKDVTDLLMQHLNLTKEEVTARLKQDWAGDIDAFDQIFTEILTVSDVLSDGIIAQFPEKFRR